MTETYGGSNNWWQTEAPACLRVRWSSRVRTRRGSVATVNPGRREPTPEVAERLQAGLPQAEAFVLPGANHGLQMINPRALADGLAAF